jgi:flagellar biosynthetic protein FliR
MELTTAEIAGWVGSVLWPFFRFAALFLLLPVFSGQSAPMFVRVALALATAILLAPLLGPVPAVDPLSAEAFLITLQQILIGMAMGLIVSVVFATLLVAGEAIAMAMGLGFAQMTDPQTGASLPVVSNFLNILGALVFLSLDGHLAVFQLLVNSFETLPVAPVGLSNDDFMAMVLWGGQMYAGAVLIALPAFAAMLMVNLGFGVITRASPALNIFAVGFPMMISLGIVVIWLALPGIVDQFTDLLNQAYALIAELVAD